MNVTSSVVLAMVCISGRSIAQPCDVIRRIRWRWRHRRRFLKSNIDVIAIGSRIILVAHHCNRGSAHWSRTQDVNYVGRGECKSRVEGTMQVVSAFLMKNGEVPSAPQRSWPIKARPSDFLSIVATATMN